jgi:site-specific DNA-adenine methylase
MTPTRPILRWHGGKWRIAPWVISHFPPHRVYVEPFGGAASVLLQKPRALSEIYNDLDRDLVRMFRVIREEPAAPLHSLPSQETSIASFTSRWTMTSKRPAGSSSGRSWV